MKKTTQKDFYNILTSTRVYNIGSVNIQKGYRDGRMIKVISDMIDKQVDKLKFYDVDTFYKKSFGAISDKGSELRHTPKAQYYKDDNKLMVDFGYTILTYYIHSYHKVVE